MTQFNYGDIIKTNRIQYPISKNEKEVNTMRIAIGSDPNAESAKIELIKHI